MAQMIFDTVFATFAMLGVIYFCIETGKFFAKRSFIKVEMKLIVPDDIDATLLIKAFCRVHAYDKRFETKIIIPDKYINNCTDPELLKLIECGEITSNPTSEWREQD